MNLEELKRKFGNEYPAAIIKDGVRMKLRNERRFSRSYPSDDGKITCVISRFMDGSASITALELRQDWASWTEEDRQDFCQSCAWLEGQSDLPEMLRFIMNHGGPANRSGVALSVASLLSRDEAFDILVRTLQSNPIGITANIGRAISELGHPDAETVLRNHLATIWAHPGLWETADFKNWIGFDATACIAYLIEVGAPPADFEKQVRQLSEHACSGNRNTCRRYLSRHYSWLKGSG